MEVTHKCGCPEPLDSSIAFRRLYAYAYTSTGPLQSPVNVVRRSAAKLILLGETSNHGSLFG